MVNKITKSKVFVKSLEDTVSYIATKVSNGYKIGNYIFPNAETLVAIVRNKLAHGNFKIDFGAAPHNSPRTVCERFCSAQPMKS